jgi:hypothetical protein
VTDEAEATDDAGAESAKEPPSDRLEVIQVIVLALVTLATAWSGFQATKWGGRQATLYGQASTTRFAADAASTLGGQVLVANATIFTAWLEAKDAGNEQLQALLERRFSPEYRAAFEDWLTTDPFTNPDAPAGPGYMPGFAEPNLEQAKELNDEASALFGEGTEARETANKYVRNTVLLASVLFLIGATRGFKSHRVRIASSAIALALLAYTVVSVIILPRA